MWKQCSECAKSVHVNALQEGMCPSCKKLADAPPVRPVTPEDPWVDRRLSPHRCLLCPHSLPFSDWWFAAEHVRAEHPAEIADSFVDEYLQHMPPEIVVPKKPSHAPPYRCAYCDAEYIQDNGITYHLTNDHDLIADAILYGRDFLSVADLEEQQKKDVERFNQTVYSLRGVGDFLTECGL